MLFHWCSVVVFVFMPAWFLMRKSAITWVTDSFFNILFFYGLFKISCFVFAFTLWLWWVRACFLWVYSMWSLLNFVHLQIHVLYQIWKLFSHYFFKYVSAPISFSSSSRTITIMYKNLWYCPTDLWESVHFLSNFFSSPFSRLDNFYWLTFKLIGPFFSSPPVCFWGLLVDILVLLLCLSIDKFPLGSLAYLFLCWKGQSFHSFWECSPLMNE